MARILHLISSNERRGAEVFALELADHLRAVGHEVHVLAIEPARSDRTVDAEVAGRSRTDPLGIARTLRAARWADVVVSFGSTSLITGAIVARMSRRPFVYRNIGDPSVWGATRLAGLRVGAPLRSARALVALYPEARAELIRRDLLDPALVRIIPRGVPAGRFSPPTAAERTDARRALGLADARRWLAYVGALSPEKDPLFAVDVLRRLPSDIGLVVAGGGPLEPELAASGGVDGRLVMLGALDDVAPVLAAADLLVLPSRTEGIPGVVIEAGLSGLTAVATSVGGVPHAIVDRVTGRLVPLDGPDEFAAAVLDALDRRAEYGAAALERCTEVFTMASVGRAWEQVIEDTTGPPPAGAAPSVLHVTASSNRRGAEVFAVQLAAALQRRGWRPSSVAVSGTSDAGNLPIRILGLGRFRPLTMWRLLRQVRRNDVVVAHGSNSLLPVCATAALARRPYVYRIIGDPSFWGRVRLARWRIGLPMRRADAVVALTEHAREWVVARYGVDPAKVVVSPNAVDQRVFRLPTADERAAARRELGVEDDRPLLGYVGSLSPEKRPNWAIRTAAACPDATLVVVGDGVDGPDLDSMADAAAPGRVRFLGTVEDPRRVLAAIDVLLLPSKTEGMPAVVVEAALCGVPTVATDVGAVREVVEHLGMGSVVEAESLDAFVAATQSMLAMLPMHRPAPVDGALDRYDIDHVAAQWERMLEAVIAGGAVDRPADHGDILAT